MRKRPKSIPVSLDHFLVDGDDGDDELAREIADSKAQPDECFENAETLRHINEALTHLSKPFRNVFVMREFYGLSYDEIVLATDCELGTVKSRISRARIKMQSQLRAANCA